MGDAEFRELERRWCETGSVEDEAAWLRARVHVGELQHGKLELAASCGHQAALFALGSAKPTCTPSLDELAKGLPKRALVRARIAKIRRIDVPFYESSGDHDYATLLARLVDAAERLLLCPCVEHERALRSLPYGEGFMQPPWPVLGMHPGSEQSTRAAVRAEIVPWALGYSDPVRERVEARQREAVNE